jgi:uncharacterized protein
MSHLELASMFLLGLSGTGHCLGMCGPLILAFPAATGRFSAHLLYHAGRVITYVTVGAAMGGIASVLPLIARKATIDPLVWTVRIQVLVSVVGAIFLLLYGLSRLSVIPEPRWMTVASPLRAPAQGSAVKRFVSRKGDWNMLLLGLMLGLLPCGLSFAAFARALAAGGPVRGAVLATAFAAGTLPGLLLLGTGISRLAVRYRTYFDMISGMLMIGMGASLFADAFRVMGGTW